MRLFVKLPVKRFLMNEHELFFAGGVEFVTTAETEFELSGAMETELFSGTEAVGATGGRVGSGRLVSTVGADAAGAAGGGLAGVVSGASCGLGATAGAVSGTGCGAGLPGGGVLCVLIKAASNAKMPITKMAIPNLFFMRAIRRLRLLINRLTLLSSQSRRRQSQTSRAIPPPCRNAASRPPRACGL